jgi:hypothetical protein
LRWYLCFALLVAVAMWQYFLQVILPAVLAWFVDVELLDESMI